VKVSQELSEAGKGQESELTSRLLDRAEDAFHIILTIILFGVATGALVFTLIRLFTTDPFFPNGMLQAVNDVLFIVIILELARTVIARFRDGFYQLSRFLIIGVIASVRHLLSVGSSLTLNTEKTQQAFDRGIIELGINTVIVLVLIFGIFLTQRMPRPPSS
jgi:uncharacterized membrane protein (DUF373 family)